MHNLQLQYISHIYIYKLYILLVKKSAPDRTCIKVILGTRVPTNFMSGEQIQQRYLGCQVNSSFEGKSIDFLGLGSDSSVPLNYYMGRLKLRTIAIRFGSINKKTKKKREIKPTARRRRPPWNYRTMRS